MASYPAYLVSTLGGGVRDHHAIFIETNEDGTGQIFQATGTMQQGMTYEKKPGERPEDALTFLKKETLGHVLESKYEQIDAVCAAIPPPKKQFQGAKRLYPKEPLRACQEWAQEAVQELRQQGVLQ